MRSLARTAAAAAEGGAALPTVFASLAAEQISIRRSELSMVAGPPGSGKSTLALSIALQTKVRTLYFAADTSAHTMALRAISALTATPQQEVEHWMDSDPQWAKDTLAHANHIRWCFDSSPSLDDLRDEIDTYREVMGSDPELVVVDNALDVTHENGDEWSSLRSLMKELKWWARDTEAAILVLHHTSESDLGDPCPPRRAIHGKVAQTPAMILTIGARNGFMAVAPVKNRYGPADQTGSKAVFLSYDPACMRLTDLESR